MSLEIKVGPPQIAVHSGLLRHGQRSRWADPRGGGQRLYFSIRGLISSWALFAGGVPWTLLNGGALAACAARVYCTNPAIHTAERTIPERTLGLIFGRHIDGGMREDIDITNYRPKPVSFNLELAIRSDFADLFEVKNKSVTRRGSISTDWANDKQALTKTYRHEDFSRALRVTASAQHAPMSYANGRLSFRVQLKAGGLWHTSLLYDLANGDGMGHGPLAGRR